MYHIKIIVYYLRKKCIYDKKICVKKTKKNNTIPPFE